MLKFSHDSTKTPTPNEISATCQQLFTIVASFLPKYALLLEIIADHRVGPCHFSGSCLDRMKCKRETKEERTPHVLAVEVVIPIIASTRGDTPPSSSTLSSGRSKTKVSGKGKGYLTIPVQRTAKEEESGKDDDASKTKKQSSLYIIYNMHEEGKATGETVCVVLSVQKGAVVGRNTTMCHRLYSLCRLPASLNERNEMRKRK